MQISSKTLYNQANVVEHQLPTLGSMQMHLHRLSELFQHISLCKGLFITTQNSKTFPYIAVYVRGANMCFEQEKEEEKESSKFGVTNNTTRFCPENMSRTSCENSQTKAAKQNCYFSKYP